MDGRVPLLTYKLPGTQGCFPGFEVFSPRSRGVSYHSQNGQYGGCVPHRPSGRFTVAVFSFGPRTSSLRAVHIPGILNLAADFLSRQKLRPREWMLDGIPDLRSVWQSGGGPLCFFEFPDDSGHRCVRPSVAECQSVCVSANKADSGSTMQSEGE